MQRTDTHPHSETLAMWNLHMKTMIQIAGLVCLMIGLALVLAV
jgi:hypothetical protein